MKIRVRVHAGARTSRTEQRGEELHNLSKSAVRLTSGHTSKTKVFELDGV